VSKSPDGFTLKWSPREGYVTQDNILDGADSAGSPAALGAVMLGLVFGVLKFVSRVDLDWSDPNVELWGTILAIPLWLVGAAVVMKWADIGS
jgi:hypothetical protein